MASAPPPVTNSTVTDLKASQSFQNDAAGMNLVLDITTKTGISGQIRPNNLSVSYDATTQSYTVSADGRSQTFGPDTVESRANGDTQYRKSGTAENNRLTVVTTPYSNPRSNQYVGLAYWQRTALSGTAQALDFYIFTYGLPTAAASVPRTGTAAFRTDVFGAVSAPGQEPRQFQGQGDFSVDFAAGVFATHSYLTEQSLVTGQGVSGGGIEFTGAGHLASAAGTFSGNALYQGWFGAAAGPLSGRFYGPAGEELGGAFSGSNASGMTVSGGFTGQRDTSQSLRNLTLTNLTSSQLFYVQYPGNLVGQLNRQNSETFTFSPPTSDLYGGQFTLADKVADSDANFTEYRKTITSSYDSQDVTVKLYKPGSSNSELVLTYASFAQYSTSVPVGTARQRVDLFGAFGLATPPGLLAGRTGTGSYRGVLYGTGRQFPSTVFYSVKGTSQFAVDFGAQSYTGALAMTGTPSNGSSTIDFGTYDVAGRLTGTGATGSLARAGMDAGQFNPHFYGPTGEEIVAPFSVTAPAGAPGAGITIQGVAAAKQQ